MGEKMYTQCKIANDITKELTICQLCSNKMDNPKDIACLHTFCKKCIEAYMEDLLKSEGIENKRCPTCDSSIPVDDFIDFMSHCSAEEWAENLPSNFLISGLIKREFLEQKEPHCSMCNRLNRKSRANYFCKDCIELVCDTCKPYHEVATHDASHTFLRIDELPRFDSEKVLNKIFQSKCTEHRDEILKVFCNDHNVPCCQICTTVIRHRKCESIDEIMDAAEAHLSKNSVKINQEQLDQQISSAIKIVQKTKKNKNDVEYQCESGLRALDTLKKHLHKITTEIVETCKQKICDFKDNAVQNSQQTEMKAEKFIKKQIHKKDILTVSSEKASAIQTMLQSLQIRNTFDTDTEALKTIESECKEFTCKVNIDVNLQEVQDMLIGKINICPSPSLPIKHPMLNSRLSNNTTKKTIRNNYGCKT